VRRLIVLPLLFGVLALLGVAVTGGATAVPDAEFTSTPESGAPGTSISVASVTPCPPNPTGVAGPRVVRVTLSRGSGQVGFVQLSVGSSGAWTGHLVVAHSAAAGAASLDAFCFSSDVAEGATVAYAARSFTVVSVAPIASISPIAQPVTG
jgi:hypothetical protein